MKKDCWQKNNPKIQYYLGLYVSLSKKECDTQEEVEEKQKTLQLLRLKLNEENLKSQLMWITVRSCKGIPCKKCYLNQVCKTFEVKDSQELAASIIKEKITRKTQNDAK